MRFRSIAAVFASVVLALAAASCGDDDGDAAGEQTTSTQADAGGESGDGPGADLSEDVAAEVGSTEIAAQQIEDEASALAESPQMSEQLGEQSGDQARELLRAEVLTYAIQAELLIGAAESLDRSVTDEDVGDARTQLEDEAGGPDALVESMESQGLSEGFLDQQIRAVAAMNNVQAAVAEQSGEGSADSTTTTAPGPNGQPPMSPEEQAAQQYLTEYAAGVEIVVNDDFGTWNAQAARVVPPGGLPGGGAPAPAPGAGSGGSGGAGGGGAGSGDAGTEGGG